MHHFRTHVIHLICFPSVEHGNPFYQHILPMIHASSLVHTAVEAVGAAHRHLLGAGTKEEATYFHSKTLHQLASTLSESDHNNFARDQALGATLLLVYYEIVLGGSAKVARCHLRGAKGLLEAGGSVSPTPSVRFLHKAFQYFDVMVSLSLRECPLNFSVAAQELQIGIDGTFGLLAGVWPLMQQLADILAYQTLTSKLLTDIERLVQQLQAWSPEQMHEALDERNTDHQAILQIAKAYKYSSLLTLYTRFPLSCLPNQSSRVADGHDFGEMRTQVEETYRQALDSLLRAGMLSGPMATLVWPLYTVAMSANSIGDKTITQHIFKQLNERQHMQVVKVARESVERSWNHPSSDQQHGLATILLG